jgi:hypothetical protein
LRSARTAPCSPRPWPAPQTTCWTSAPPTSRGRHWHPGSAASRQSRSAPTASGWPLAARTHQPRYSWTSAAEC